jgi:hypothetical protein
MTLYNSFFNEQLTFLKLLEKDSDLQHAIIFTEDVTNSIREVLTGQHS